jgi:putative hemolysin
MMEYTTAYKALEQFKTGIHYAFVSDEYGIFRASLHLMIF